jgi:hypothetical protein
MSKARAAQLAEAKAAFGPDAKAGATSARNRPAAAEART